MFYGLWKPSVDARLNPCALVSISLSNCIHRVVEPILYIFVSYDTCHNGVVFHFRSLFEGFTLLFCVLSSTFDLHLCHAEPASSDNYFLQSMLPFPLFVFKSTEGSCDMRHIL
jgi:hypothetical protein